MHPFDCVSAKGFGFLLPQLLHILGRKDFDIPDIVHKCPENIVYISIHNAVARPFKILDWFVLNKHMESGRYETKDQVAK